MLPWQQHPWGSPRAGYKQWYQGLHHAAAMGTWGTKAQQFGVCWQKGQEGPELSTHSKACLTKWVGMHAVSSVLMQLHA